MSYFYDVAVAFKLEDWNDVALALRNWVCDRERITSNLLVDDFIRKHLKPDIYTRIGRYVVLKWDWCNYWTHENHGAHDFFLKMTEAYECDYLVINEDNEVEIDNNDLGIVSFQLNQSIVTGQPCLIESWRIINVLIHILEKKHGYSYDDIRKAINKYTKSKLGNYCNFSILEWHGER